jgi:hypothetical protein
MVHVCVMGVTVFPNPLTLLDGIFRSVPGTKSFLLYDIVRDAQLSTLTSNESVPKSMYCLCRHCGFLLSVGYAVCNVIICLGRCAFGTTYNLFDTTDF